MNNDLYNTSLLRTHKLANPLQSRAQLELFVEHVITHADHNVQIIVEEERKSFEDDLAERFAQHMNNLWSQKTNNKKGLKQSHLNRSTIDCTNNR